MIGRYLQLVIFAAALAGMGAIQIARAEELSGAPLVHALRQGGYVLLMRHASSPNAVPDKSSADPGNVNLERQLDKHGRSAARAMGKAIKALHIPIREVWSSPTYRAKETVRLAALGNPQAFAELGDGGQSMQALQASPTVWLRTKIAEVPPAGSDRVIVTHAPNIIGALGQSVADIADGETLVFHPDGKGGAVLVARVKIEEWAQLASLK
jgi:phosphohistidine phosphatase SixA